MEVLRGQIFLQAHYQLGLIGKYENGSFTIAGIPTVAGTFNYTITTTGPCQNASVTGSITVDPLLVGGTLSFGSVGRIFMICENPSKESLTPLTLSGITGHIKVWKYRKSSSTSWTPIQQNGSNFTGSTLSRDQIFALGLNETISFQVEIESGACTPNVLSPRAILSIVPSDIEPAPVTITPGVVCYGANVTLSSSTGYASGGDIGGGEFDNSSITNHGWRVKRDGNNTDLGFNSGANNTRPAIWLRVNPHEFSTANVNNPTNNPPDVTWDSNPSNQGNKGFAIISGANAATLETPVFNTFAMETGKLTFDQAYNLTSGASISVDISTDGGATYQTPPLYYKAGPESSGYFNGFSAGDSDNQISLNLENYLGEGNLRIRFHFIGTRVGDVWAIDNMDLPDGPNGVGMVWRDYTDPAAPITIGTSTSEQWQPKIIGWNTFEVRTTLQLNSEGQACQSIENFERVKAFVFDTYTATATATGGSCGNSSTKLTATVVSGTKGAMAEFNTPGYTTPDGYTGKWEVTGPNGYSYSASHFTPAVNDPNAVFTPNYQGEFSLNWKLTPTTKGEDGNLIENQTCPPASTPIKVTIQDCSKLDFDGVDDFVDLGEEYTGDYSIEAWIRPEAATSTIISTLQLEINMADLSGLVIPNSRWYHIAVDSDGKLYVDGIYTDKNISKAGTTRAFIGARWNAPNPENFFSGWIEEVRIWNGKIEQEQIRFLMNQRLQTGANIGVKIPMPAPGLPYSSLSGYYQLLANNILNGGYTLDLAGNSVNGKLRNMETLQENTAPLPYTSAADGDWTTRATWTQPVVWDYPNSTGYNGTPIEWNIVEISHNIESQAKDITVLGLISVENELTIAAPGAQNEFNSGQFLRVSHYLKLDGGIDLVGESQLLQDLESIVDLQSSGWLERDQQGTANSYNYNYWSSPVSSKAGNIPYTIKGAMKDGTNSAIGAFADLQFGTPYAHADGAAANPRKVSSYWLNLFHGNENVYAEWIKITEDTGIPVGEGYTMKGTAGNAAISDRQNYTFRGIPNNGTIHLSIAAEHSYLIGNPYPSAIDANEFIKDNLEDVAQGKNDGNSFNGSLYFWSHFAGGDTHILKEYIGGYAVYNLAGGVKAIANDYRINYEAGGSGGEVPERFIPSWTILFYKFYICW
ncbi:LamG domain-containing protein [Antarcticibacterium sp. 1MA-6-2]|uniref:LamG domain-containing protein n=1 Tax=Antarcticibacterium sp. 1MA-6-2 TaxID=2908210 RepID=UPI001F2DD043|nr:LamG domain-containing protein [Antarcticibacterium sp. 1MA-6-2]UJH93044.1 LamG domain-containing protein [Antarcticibacterium sp. 1MA-6-2]